MKMFIDDYCTTSFMNCINLDNDYKNQKQILIENFKNNYILIEKENKQLKNEIVKSQITLNNSNMDQLESRIKKLEKELKSEKEKNNNLELIIYEYKNVLIKIKNKYSNLKKLYNSDVLNQINIIEKLQDTVKRYKKLLKKTYIYIFST